MVRLAEMAHRWLIIKLVGKRSVLANCTVHAGDHKSLVGIGQNVDATVKMYSPDALIIGSMFIGKTTVTQYWPEAETDE